MITSTIDNLKLYRHLHPNLAKAIDYIDRTDFAKMKPGKYDVDGEQVFFMINEYNTKPAADCEPERHRRYTDIQFMIKGEEKFGYTPFTDQPCSTDFLPDNDVAFYKLSEQVINYVLLSPGQFIIFLPTDIHQPEVYVNAPSPVRKVVFKIDLTDL
ncbi:MAG: YhcH/YjgK/YiaL family protein [Chitinophagaceae bacterium]